VPAFFGGGIWSDSRCGVLHLLYRKYDIDHTCKFESLKPSQSLIGTSKQPDSMVYRQKSHQIYQLGISIEVLALPSSY
jgi:hypothetical protein